MKHSCSSIAAAVLVSACTTACSLDLGKCHPIDAAGARSAECGVPDDTASAGDADSPGVDPNAEGDLDQGDVGLSRGSVVVDFESLPINERMANPLEIGGLR